MAMFDTQGYCPSSTFLHYGETYKVSPLWERAQEILGDRIDYMVYTEGGNSYKGGFIVDALEGAEGTLGIEVAVALKMLIPTCECNKAGKQILCTDVVNPSVIPAPLIEQEEKWVCFDASKITTFLFEDNRYLIAIQEHDCHVRVYIYKK